MAAKQGLTAHLSQASEDAKRAMLNRAPTSIKSHSWLSNLNTTCTIKSAPPRTPEVMTMLSTKHGWLVKRNEQHVWQRRWCCVVPHTFLYYFEAEPLEEGMLGQGSEYESVEVKHPTEGYQPSTTNLSPVGIIDLECYTTINRASSDETVLELCGDAITNPDLRSFYFQSDSVEDAECWTNALLSDRHSALKDEREAYRQVCESFPMQLQQCSDMIDAAEQKAHEAEKECYSVRSNAEESRRKVIQLVRDALDTQNHNQNLENARQALLADLDAMLAAPDPTMNGGAPEAVKLIIEYNTAIKNAHHELSKNHDSLRSRLDRHTHVDKRREEELNAKIKHLTAQHQAQMKSKEDTIKTLQDKLAKMQTALDDAHHNIKGQTMDFNMYQNATKSKLSELHQHKKILKKEVIDLRKKIDEMGSETNMLYHKNENLENSVKNEQQRNQVLEKYVTNMEKQVSVQQNMMEMMSVNAGASVVGRVIGGSSSNLGAAMDNNSLCGGASLDPYSAPIHTPRAPETSSVSNRIGLGASYNHAQAPPTPPRSRPPPSLSLSSTAQNANDTVPSNLVVSSADQQLQQQQQHQTLDVIDYGSLINQNNDKSANSHDNKASQFSEELSPQIVPNSSNNSPPAAQTNGENNSPPADSAQDGCNAPTDQNDFNNPQSSDKGLHEGDIVSNNNNGDALLQQQTRKPLNLADSGKAVSERTMSIANTNDADTMDNIHGKEHDNVVTRNKNNDQALGGGSHNSNSIPRGGEGEEGKQHQPSGELTRRRERYQRAMMAVSSSSGGNPLQSTDILDANVVKERNHTINNFFDNQGQYGVDDDDDNDDEKSRLSELTEDRTEKHFGKHHNDVNGIVKANVTVGGKIVSSTNPVEADEAIARAGAISGANDGAMQPALSLSVNPQNNHSYPPRYVLGLGGTEPEHREGAIVAGTSNTRGDSGRVGKPPKAMTRSSSIPSLPPSALPSPSNNSHQSFAGRGWANALPSAQQQPNSDEVTVSTMGSFASASQLQQVPPQQQPVTQKLSVAQRARIEADSHRSGVNHLRIPPSAREKNTSSPTRERSTTTTAASSSGNASVSSASNRNASPTPSRSSTRAGRGSFFSSIGKSITDALDNSVLGVPSPPNSPGASNDAASTSTATTPALTTTPATPAVAGGTQNEAGLESPGIVRSASLAERQQLQRERQLAFLKEQGLIKDEASIQGGAGGGGTPRHGFLRSSGSFTSDAGSQVSVGSRGIFGRRGGSD